MGGFVHMCLRISVLETLCSEDSRLLAGCGRDPGHRAARSPDHHWCRGHTDSVNGGSAADTMDLQPLQAFLWYRLDWPTEINMSQHLIAGNSSSKPKTLGCITVSPPPQPLLAFPHGAQSGSALQTRCVLIPSTQSLPCPIDPSILLCLVTQSLSV